MRLENQVMNINIEDVRDLDAFSAVDDAVISELIDKHLLYGKKYNKTKTVHEQGKICDTVDIVISGKLMAYSLSQNGSENVLCEFIKDNMIGANLLFGSSNVYPLNIYCMDDCKLIHIKKEGILILLKNYEFSLKFIKYVSNNSLSMNNKIKIYTQKSLRENILDYFMGLSVEQNSKIINLTITKKQLADFLGVQRPSLFRELKKLKDEGVIEVNGKEIVLK